MGRYALRRLLLVVPTLFVVSVAAFALSHGAPGDPATQSLRRAGQDRRPTPAEAARERHRLGLDRPLVVQYLSWSGDVVRGDLGRSYSSGRPVATEFATRIPYTLTLTIPALVLVVVLALPAGTWAAARHHRAADHVLRVGSLAGVSMPSFWLALLLIAVFAVRLSWFPVAGARGSLSWVLPVVTIAIAPAALLARFTRAALLDTLGADHIRAARAKGLRDGQIVWRHGLPGALVPIVTAMGLVAGGLLAGDVVVETVFSWPGMGQLGVSAIRSRDYPVIAAFALYAGAAFALVNIVIDLSCALIDPRLRLDGPAEQPA